ncbi:MAG: hypothetical protein RI947_1239 [Candidatus Parcubacteria bacterium]|jgi:ATP-dependent Clp protease ATP-binding subunit ClpA
MYGKFNRYLKESMKHFFEALVNIAIFLPYFFSVSALLKSLFSPWKNLTSHKTTVGFSFSDWFSRLSFDMVSRGMGFVMRMALLTTYLILQILYVILMPFIIIFYFILIPLYFFVSQYSKTEDERKLELKNRFITSHMINKDNFQEVEAWFEKLYVLNYKDKEWWKLQNLKAIPPIARDWTMGFTPNLDQYVTDLTHPTYQAYIKNLVDREAEINQIERVLSKTDEANVILVGDEGVGRHSIVDAFSQRIYEGRSTQQLMYKRLLKLNMQKVLVKYTDQQQREEFLEELLMEAADAHNVIMLIENIDKYVSLGAERIDLSIPLQKYAKSSIQIIGLTSPFLYQKYIQSNENIMRLFTKIDVNEVDKIHAMEIMLDIAPQFETRYRAYIPYDTVQTVVEKSDFYITSVPFPEKSMQLLDNACIYTVQTMKKNVVTPVAVDVILTEKTHVPTILTSSMKDNLLKLEMHLQSKIVSQHEAIKQLASALRRSFVLMGKRKKPLASFLFIGPTGVGKTETAKAISEVFFGTPDLVRFDMSEYQSKDTLVELIGSMERNNPGRLTEAIREHPYGVLLLDEIEKANKDLLNIFLTILDEGYYTDGYGKKVDCKNLVIIATSNAGAAYIYDHLKNNPLELTDDAISKFQQELIRYLVDKGIYAPEFLNRFDGIVAYQPLQEDNAVLVARKFLQTVTEQILSLYKIKVRVSDETLQSIAVKSYDPAFGARDMERVLRQNIEDKIAKLILEGKVKEGDTINL